MKLHKLFRWHRHRALQDLAGPLIRVPDLLLFFISQRHDPQRKDLVDLSPIEQVAGTFRGDLRVQALRANEIAGVTVYRGILGYGANRRIHKDSTLNLSHDAPVLLTGVDREEKLRAFFPVLDQMVKQGLVVLSDVDVIKYSHAESLPASQEAQR